VSSNSIVAHTDESATLYYSYLVRLWRSGAQSPLHASAQCIQTGEITYFADLPRLFAFLKSRTELPSDAAQLPSPQGSE
jgi:hypothetical protein